MTTRIFRKILTDFAIGKRRLHVTANLSSFYERDRKSGYKTVYDRPPPEQSLSIIGRLREGYRQFKEEFGIWLEEMKEQFRMDPTLMYRTNEVDVVWRFNRDPKSLDQWVITCDSDYEEGFSTAKLELSPNGTGIFSGTLSTRLPKDGRIKNAGFCNITTIPKQKSFKRDVCHDWTPYTHLVLRIRGDGRSYVLNISTRGIFDLMWNDVYHYVLYTRGGPYWQYVRIPFSKFVFASKGRLQDNQTVIMLHEVTNFGISLGDDINGRFKLEIDYIGLECEEYHNEEFAYESYNFSGVRF